MSGTERGQRESLKDVRRHETCVNCTSFLTPQDGGIELFHASLQCDTQNMCFLRFKEMFSAHPGMKTLLKKYELPKSEEVNVYKQKLERIHVELATSSK